MREKRRMKYCIRGAGDDTVREMTRRMDDGEEERGVKVKDRFTRTKI